MNVLFIAPYVPSLIRVRPYHFVHRLSGRHQVTLLAVGSERDADAVADLRQVCRRVEVVPLKWSGSLRSLGWAAMRGEPLQSAVCHSQGLQQRLRAMLDDQDFDVVHIEHLRAARLHSVLQPRMPTVFDSVDSISLLLERTLRSSHSQKQRLVAALELKRTRAYEARLMSRFDHVVVTAADDAATLRGLNPRATLSVIPNGVDLGQFAPFDEPPEPATLVFSGKMSYHANVSALLHFVRDILPILHASRPDVRVRVVGSNPPPEVQALAHDPRITITGYVADMRQALRGATAAICPVTVKVGIQNKVLEAMALGLPVVCSRIGAEGIDAVPGQDFLVANDSADFAHLLEQLLADPSMRGRVGHAGRRYVENNHRWDRATEKLEQAYRAAIEHNRISTAPRSISA